MIAAAGIAKAHGQPSGSAGRYVSRRRSTQTAQPMATSSTAIATSANGAPRKIISGTKSAPSTPVARGAVIVAHSAERVTSAAGNHPSAYVTTSPSTPAITTATPS